ncbi:RNA polymerase sigma factor [Edaphobacter dinghuensis]|nr:sigma-70 family RNA polymerase sigma factor [Edaphobacter dinghuensis]
MSGLEPSNQKAHSHLQTEISELFASLRLPLYRYFLAGTGSASDAEDLTQECFLRLYRYLRKGNQIDNPKLWLFHAAHNLLLDRHKSARYTREVDLPVWDSFVEAHYDSSPNPEESLIQRERYAYMADAMHKLTSQQREVLILKTEGLGYREIGEIMSLSTFAVAAHVRRAIAKMKVGSHGQR